MGHVLEILVHGGWGAVLLYKENRKEISGGSKNTTNFCGNCGEQRPGTTKWTCPDCKTENTTNFCTTCGKEKPE